MNYTINISKRLTMIASYLPKGAFFADIGSDHAYLPCYVCLHDQTARAIAGEVNKGPYQSARETVATYELTDQIEVRLGDGLEVLEDRLVKQVVIAGMGGSLIMNILDEGKKYLSDVERIIAQPNIGERNVRKWFLENNFTMVQEIIVEENDHLYEILVAEKGNKDQPYSDQLEKELFFGPILLKEKSKVFLKKWEIQKEKSKKVIEQMKQATVQNEEKVQQLERELHWIEEVINDGNKYD